MKVDKKKLEIAFRIKGKSPDVDFEDLLALIGAEEIEDVETPKVPLSDSKNSDTAILPRKNKNWSKEEDRLLRNFRKQGLTTSEIGKRLGRSSKAITNRVQKIGLTKENSLSPVWTDEEDQELMRLMQSGLTYLQASEKLGRTYHSVVSRWNKIRKDLENKKHTKLTNELWTDEEEQTLIRLKNEGYSLSEAALKMDRPYHSVRHKWRRMNNLAAESDDVESKIDIPTRITAFQQKKIKSFLIQHNNDIDKIKPVEYTELAKELMIERSKCVQMVYDVWKEKYAI